MAQVDVSTSRVRKVAAAWSRGCVMSVMLVAGLVGARIHLRQRRRRSRDWHRYQCPMVVLAAVAVVVYVDCRLPQVSGT